MIKTEATRTVITACEQLKPPQDVVEALQHHNSRLELIWNSDVGRWEIYQLKLRGITSGEDVLCWQMSAPNLGSNIGIGIVDWLKKYDTTNGGMKSVEELQNEWKNYCVNLFTKIEPDRLQKKIDDAILNSRDLVDSWLKEKVSVVVPQKVGYSTKLGKQIFAVKKPRRLVNGL